MTYGFVVEAELGVRDASGAVGLFYYHGMGVDQDYVRAAELLRLAAAWGNLEAQHIMGWMHAFGQGNVEKDFAEAYFWLRLAESRGGHEAGDLGWALSDKLSSDDIAAIKARVLAW